MIAGNGFEPLAGRPPDRGAGFSHATVRLPPRNRSAFDVAKCPQAGPLSALPHSRSTDGKDTRRCEPSRKSVLAVGWDGSSEPRASQQALRAWQRARAVKASRCVGRAVRAARRLGVGSPEPGE